MAENRAVSFKLEGQFPRPGAPFRVGGLEASADEHDHTVLQSFHTRDGRYYVVSLFMLDLNERDRLAAIENDDDPGYYGEEPCPWSVIWRIIQTNDATLEDDMEWTLTYVDDCELSLATEWQLVRKFEYDNGLDTDAGIKPVAEGAKPDMRPICGECGDFVNSDHDGGKCSRAPKGVQS